MHLLVAIDDSPHAQACIREVASRPWPEGTHVRVLSATGLHPGAPLPQPGLPAATVMQVPPPGMMSFEVQHYAMETARRVAQDGADTLARCGLHAQSRVREGTPASVIVDEASEWPADLIVVGSRGRGALKRFLLGSVANYVVQHAPCSVEVVRKSEST